jgi:hypothetical protein
MFSPKRIVFQASCKTITNLLVFDKRGNQTDFPACFYKHFLLNYHGDILL